MNDVRADRSPRREDVRMPIADLSRRTIFRFKPKDAAGGVEQ